MLPSMVKMDFANVTKIMDSEVGRIAWIIRVVLIQANPANVSTQLCLLFLLIYLVFYLSLCMSKAGYSLWGNQLCSLMSGWLFWLGSGYHRVPVLQECERRVNLDYLFLWHLSFLTMGLQWCCFSVAFSSNNFRKRLLFPHWNISAPLWKINWP